MSLICLMLKNLGMDAKNEWLWPRLWRLIYRVQLACIVIAVQVGFWRLLSNTYKMANNLSRPFAFLWTMILIIVILLVILFLACCWNRVAYEGAMLLFRLFESNRETVEKLESANAELKILNAVAERSRNMHAKALQYMCDRLAQICDNTEKR